jgi:UDP-glucuronate decarboxylase
MRILVTGGAGFIGSHLIDRLMEQGHEVICVDNFYTGHKRNILKWLDHPYFELIRHDITEPIRLEVDQIYHLACPASPVHYQYNPVKTIKTNVMGTLNMLGLAKRVKARFLLASTSEVYGDPEIHPQVEEYRGNVNPIGIRSCYDEGKRVAETLAFDYHRQNDVEIRVARIFNTYGPRMLENDGRVVSNFVVQALQGHPLTIYGDGSQTRSFCYASDLVEGLIRLMNGNYIGPVNLGNPDEYTILELAQAVQQMVNPEVALKFKPLPEDDPRRRKPDITKALTWLGWQPTVPLQEGLRLTVEDFRSRMEDSLRDGAEYVVLP